MVLETPRLRLRPFTLEDVDDLFALGSDPEVMRYGSRPPWTLRAEAEARLQTFLTASPDAWQWVIAERATGRFLGNCALFNGVSAHARCEVGYSLARAEQGQGFASEAVRRILTHAFESLAMKRIEADVDPRNERSWRLLEKLGFRREGHLRERWRVGGEVQDAFLYGLLKSEFRV